MVRKMYPNKVRAVKNQSYKFLMSLASLAQTNHDRGEADRDTIIGRYMSATYPMGLRTTWEPNARPADPEILEIACRGNPSWTENEAYDKLSQLGIVSMTLNEIRDQCRPENK